ncbi:MAG: AMP-binding protein [Deltaproteobacteria bacterium]|nr:AMP-binding protein [Deltaproteobacteria bacterium]MBW2392706.1 AMP-binding protein [Deltaproteobacteria bacterium]
MIRTDTLWELVEARAEATPEGLFGIDESGLEMTFGEYRKAAEHLAAALYERGVRENSAVSWILPTCFNALVLLAALSRLGAVQNPIIPIYRGREVSHCLRQTGAQLLIVIERFRGFEYGEMANELAGKIEGLDVLITSDEPWESQLPDTTAMLPPAPSAGNKLRWIFYTSGTTSEPKGARHADKGFLAASFGLADAMGLSPSDRIGLVFPVTHLGGVNSLVAALSTGASHLIVESFDPPTTIPFLGKHGVTHAGAGTAFHRMYLEAQRKRGEKPIFPNIRVFQGGGAPKPPPLHYALKDECGAGILSVYGMTECPVLALGRFDDPDEQLATTEGRLNLPETELKIVMADGSLAAVGVEGELRVRAPQLFLGYLDEALNSDAFDEEGFYRTGDLGFIDERDCITVSGRLKDVIIRKGENISAPEVEGLLLEHPKLADASVIGVPDEVRGEMVCAVVVLREATEPLAFEEMVEYLRGKELMVQKIPERMEIVEALPRNPSGKVLKRELRKQFAGTG